MSEQNKFEGISPLRLMQGKAKDGAWQMITREEAIVRYGDLHRQMVSDRSKRATFFAFLTLCRMAFGEGFEGDAYEAMQAAQQGDLSITLDMNGGELTHCNGGQLEVIDG